MLLKKPMVVAYRLAPLTFWILKRMVKSPYVSLPNLLAQRLLVPEPVEYGLQLHSLRLDQDLGFATLTALVGYSEKERRLVTDNTEFYSEFAPIDDDTPGRRPGAPLHRRRGADPDPSRLFCGRMRPPGL